MNNEILTREEMLVYLRAFGRCAPEYYEKLDDKKLVQEYNDATKA
ncbi:hypothetical protein ACQKEY_22530 [Lysinibacillus fusiformis]